MDPRSESLEKRTFDQLVETLQRAADGNNPALNKYCILLRNIMYGYLGVKFPDPGKATSGIVPLHDLASQSVNIHHDTSQFADLMKSLRDAARVNMMVGGGKDVEKIHNVIMDIIVQYNNYAEARNNIRDRHQGPSFR